MEEQSKKDPSKPIVIQETPEMANWMHPQTEERKQLIQERYAQLKEKLKEHREKMNEE